MSGKTLIDARADELFATMPRICRLVTVPKGMMVEGFRVTQTLQGETLAWLPAGMEIAS